MTAKLAPNRAKTTLVLSHLRRIIHAVHAQSVAIEEATGVTGPQLWGLRVVSNQLDGISLGELAARLVLHKANAGRLVDRLATKGLVRRETSALDRRVVLVRPTSAGRRLAERAVANPAQADLLGRLDALPPSQLDGIERALAQVVALLGAESVEPAPLFDDTSGTSSGGREPVRTRGRRKPLGRPAS